MTDWLKGFRFFPLGIAGVSALLVLAVAPVGAAPAGKGPNANLVDCAGGSINDALNAGIADITIRGVCDEQVEIRTSNVTLRGENPGDGINFTADTRAAVVVHGAQNVFLEDLTISAVRRAVQVSFGGAAFISDNALTSNTAATHAMVVSDNSWARVVNSDVVGVLAVRQSIVRLFRTTVASPGDALNSSLLLNGSQAQVLGSDLLGQVAVNWLSRLEFARNFLGVDYGISNVSNTVGGQPGVAIQCSAYSAVTAFPTGSVEDGAGNLLTTDDIVDFSWPGDSEDYCTELGFPPPA